MQQIPLCFLNGMVHSISDTQNRAQAYGDGVFETIRIVDSCAPLLPLHINRLKEGLTCLHIGHSDKTWRDIADFFDILSRTESSGKVKIIAYREQGGHGYQPDLNASANILIFFEATSINGWQQETKQLIDAAMPLSFNPNLAKIKHLNRLDYILAAAKTPSEKSQLLVLFDIHKHVVESLHHNIFILKDNSIATPKLDNGGVEGVFKTWLIKDVLSQMGVSVQEAIIHKEDLLRADAIFVTNALTGVTPISHYENKNYNAASFFNRLNKAIMFALKNGMSND